MFELNAITEITGEVTLNTNLTELDVEHCSKLLVAESIADMTRPIRSLSNNERIAIQQQFNRAIAQKIAKADGSTNDALVEVMKIAAQKVQQANQTGDDDVIDEAVQRLQKVINLLSDLASNVARNSYYRNEECLNMETPAADGKDSVGIDGASGAYQTRSRYAGWKSVIVESTTMTDAADEAINGLKSAINALLPLASSYLQTLLTNDRGEVHIQLGYRRDDATGEVEQFYSRQDVWNDIQANRRQATAPMSAADAVAAFNL